MGSGNTTTTALTESLDEITSSARTVREYAGVMQQLVDRKTLGKGIGLSWKEVTYAALTATSVTESTVLDNPQQLSDSAMTVTPTVIGIETLITDRVAERLNKLALAQHGKLAQEAIERKKDEDGLVVLDGSTTSLCGAGSTLTSGHISAAKYRISSNTTEPGNPPYRCVLHGYQIKDLFDELVAGVGTYVVNDGATADVFKNGWTLPIAGCEIYEDGNITIDSDADAKGGVFSQEAIVLVQGRSPWVKTVRREDIGGGATIVYHYDEYAYGERSAGNWLFELYSDATAPTS